MKQLCKVFLVWAFIFFSNNINAQIPGDLPWTAGTTCDGETVYLDDGIQVVTCGTNSPNGKVMAATDPRALTYALADQMPGEWYHPDWTLSKIGNIYFTEIDDKGFIYAPASTFTTITNPGAPGTTLRDYGSIGGSNAVDAYGAVYRMDNVTGQPIVWARLPQRQNFQPGLGGAAYDPICERVYIANMEDGMIYVFDRNAPGPFPLTTADALQIYDPLTPDTGNNGFPPVGERVFGLDIYNGRLYYTVVEGNAEMLHVRSVALNACAIDGSDDVQEVFEAMEDGNPSQRQHIADIDISSDGKMAVGTLTNKALFGNQTYVDMYNHNGINYVYELSGSTWTRTKVTTVGQILWSGNTNGTSTGGVAWNDCGETGGEDILWMSGGDFYDGDGQWGIVGYEFNSLGNVVVQESSTTFIQYLFSLPGNLNNGSTDPKGVGGDVDRVCLCACDIAAITPDLNCTCPVGNTVDLPVEVNFGTDPSGQNITVSTSNGASQVFVAGSALTQTFTLMGVSTTATTPVTLTVDNGSCNQTMDICLPCFTETIVNLPPQNETGNASTASTGGDNAANLSGSISAAGSAAGVSNSSLINGTNVVATLVLDHTVPAGTSITISIANNNANGAADISDGTNTQSFSDGANQDIVQHINFVTGASTNTITITRTGGSVWIDGVEYTVTITPTEIQCISSCSSCTNPTAPVVSVTDNVCPATTGTINIDTPCAAGSSIEYSTDGGVSWTTTQPTYTTSSITFLSRCVDDGDASCFSTSDSDTTNPTSCSGCTNPTAPVVSVTNNTCPSTTNGSFNVDTGCGVGSTIEYSTDGGTTWVATLPAWADGVSLVARCVDDGDATCFSPNSNSVTATLTNCNGPCPTPNCATITIQN